MKMAQTTSLIWSCWEDSLHLGSLAVELEEHPQSPRPNQWGWGAWTNGAYIFKRHVLEAQV